MKLELSPRDMLIARMQVYCYEMVPQSESHKAHDIARITLNNYDKMVAENTQEAGYLANFYFHVFRDDMEMEND